MAKKKSNFLPILGAAVGTGLAVYGIRRGIKWYLQQQPSMRTGSQRIVEEIAYEPIPATGPMLSTAVQEIEMSQDLAQRDFEITSGKSPSELTRRDRSTDFDDSGTAFSATEMSNTRIDELTSEDRDMSGSGIHSASIGTPGEMNTEGTLTGQQRETEVPPPLVVDDFVSRLIEHAIAFNSVMNLLRSRQVDGEGYEGTESLTPSDRSSMRAVLDQMQGEVVQYNEQDLRQNPLIWRSYQLTRKLREALDNLNYSGDDLLRINDEVAKELCRLTIDLDKSGSVTITGLDHIRQLYEC